MMTKVFAVYDSKGLMYQAPFFMPAIGAAVRMFGDAIADPKTTLSLHPTDYALYQVGEFNDNSGELISTTPPLHLAHGAEFVKRSSDPVRQALENPLQTVSELNGAAQ